VVLHALSTVFEHHFFLSQLPRVLQTLPFVLARVLLQEGAASQGPHLLLLLAEDLDSVLVSGAEHLLELPVCCSADDTRPGQAVGWCRAVS